MSQPKVSIIIPVFNQDKKLFKTCLSSAFGQDYGNIEYILVDDGSTDDTPAICDEIANIHNNVRVIHKSNQRQGGARNAGIDTCSGDYIFFLDSDDWIERNTISTLVSFILKYDADIAVCGCFKQTADGIIHKKEFLNPVVKILNNFEAFQSYAFNTPYCSHSPCDKLYDKKLFTHARFIVDSYFEDLGSVYKFIEHAKKVVYTNEQLYCYYDNQNSTMHKSFSTHEFDKIRIYHMLSDYFRYKSDTNDYEAIIRQMDRETMYCAIGYIHQSMKATDAQKYLRTIEKTRQICRSIQSDIGWKLNMLRKILVFSPQFFNIVWNSYNRK